MAHGDPNHLLHAPPSLHQAQTGASHASHSAPARRLLQQPVSPAWTMTYAAVQGRQDRSRERDDYLAAVGPPRDLEVSQRSHPSAQPHDLDHYQVLSPENRALLLMRNTMPMMWLQRGGIWMNLSGTLQCGWSWRDATVKINIRKELWNHRHGKDRLKRQYMKVAELSACSPALI